MHVWDTIVAFVIAFFNNTKCTLLLTCRNQLTRLAENVKEVVLIGQSIGCNALINLVNRRCKCPACGKDPLLSNHNVCLQPSLVDNVSRP